MTAHNSQPGMKSWANGGPMLIHLGWFRQARFLPFVSWRIIESCRIGLRRWCGHWCSSFGGNGNKNLKKKISWFLLWHHGFHFLLHVLCIAALQTQESAMCWLELASVPFQQEMMDIKDIKGGHSHLFWMRCPASTRHKPSSNCHHLGAN